MALNLDLEVEHRLLIMAARTRVLAPLVELGGPILTLHHPVDPLIRVLVHWDLSFRGTRAATHTISHADQAEGKQAARASRQRG